MAERNSSGKVPGYPGAQIRRSATCRSNRKPQTAVIFSPSIHPDPVIEGAVAASCQSLAGVQAFAEQCPGAPQAGHRAGNPRGMNTEDHEALYAVALKLYGAKDYERALPVGLALVAHEARSVKYAYLTGLCLQKLKRHREAAVMYLLALGQDATHAPSAFRMGECCAALGDDEASQQAYEHAVALGQANERYLHLQHAALARLN